MKQKQMNIKYVSLTLVIFDKAFFSSSSSFLFIFSLFFSLFFKLLVFFFSSCATRNLIEFIKQVRQGYIVNLIPYMRLHVTASEKNELGQIWLNSAWGPKYHDLKWHLLLFEVS